MFTFMASIAHHLSHLLLFTILLHTSINGNPTKSPTIPYPSFDCGNSLVISYPFWLKSQQNNDEYCGYPGFDLSCTDRQPLLRLFNHLYRLKNINYSENTLTAAYLELNNGACPIAPHDVRLNLNISYFLNYTIEDKMVHFFYNCTLYPPSLSSIACLQHGLKRSYVFMEGAIPEFDWQRFCESTVSAVVVEKGGDGGFLGGGFGRVLQDGFKLGWRSPDSDCRACEATGGFCGYRYSDGLHRNFICICSDGRRSDNCHDNGAVTVALEPNFVAIGAVICGGLIIASTVFYFIMKKKISSHKPAFTLIPNSGK
ncbi:LEAF RUST 10 DISEASE-RESISTANCE LOCUS RECEPTOR-LIKE PROTEIN KINASE-like 1.2 [Camellia sinensis]|uniref:non-specific serine/threonine protein kinase n=1 Tax=Camellia sinensis var. sinensis TaxID=542762 RepID=A0A4S4ENK0_CAMSN|nr:LEAF RUST 10 DISEASE-RESISTANCE LOCUS RECEPTOR-LIKE PROTEIN KINASE-like 1.2 [Camellia sinensis]THG18261.1 hypothetical protein TEA_017205 [Camellia sinensis var. sinensis]